MALVPSRMRDHTNAGGAAMTPPAPAEPGLREAEWVITRAYERTASPDAMVRYLWEHGYEIRPIEAAQPQQEGLREAALSPEAREYLAVREKGLRPPSKRDLQQQVMECEEALAATEAALAAAPAETFVNALGHTVKGALNGALAVAISGEQQPIDAARLVEPVLDRLRLYGFEVVDMGLAEYARAGEGNE